MKLSVCLCSILCCALLGFAAEDTPEARREAAKVYLKVMPLDKTLEQVSASVLAQLPAQARAEAKETLAAINPAPLEAIIMDAMIQTFTLDEINAMRAFYASPEGRSILKKMPQFTNAYMPKMMEEVQRIVLASMAKKQQPAAPAAKPAVTK